MKLAQWQNCFMRSVRSAMEVRQFQCQPERETARNLETHFLKKTCPQHATKCADENALLLW
jgi:hypothetical protein